MTEDLLRQAIQAIKSGDKERGKRLLAQVIRQEPRNELAWLWLSKCVPEYERKLYCIKRVLEINPDNAIAQRALARLQSYQRVKAPPVSPSSQQKPKKTRASTILILIFVAIVLGCGCLFGIAILSNSNDRSGDNRETASQRVQLGEQAYLEEMLNIGTSYSLALTRLGELGEAVSENPYLLLDTEWRAEIFSIIATIKRLNARVRSIDPPDRFAEAHEDLVEAAEHLDKFANLFTEGVENLDADKLSQALAELKLGTAAVERAGEKFEEILGSR